jgi:hypothetical protein
VTKSVKGRADVPSLHDHAGCKAGVDDESTAPAVEVRCMSEPSSPNWGEESRAEQRKVPS